MTDRIPHPTCKMQKCKVQWASEIPKGVNKTGRPTETSEREADVALSNAIAIVARVTSGQFFLIAVERRPATKLRGPLRIAYFNSDSHLVGRLQAKDERFERVPK